MAILIKNPEVERKARELASLRGLGITAAIDGALDRALAEARPKARLTVDEIEAATLKLWRDAGREPDDPLPPITKEEWDEINEIPGLCEDED
jgi:antitoxin VapB